MPSPTHVAKGIYDIYRSYQGYQRLTPTQRQRFAAILTKEDLTDADRRAWTKLGHKWHGVEMNAYQELKWRWELFHRRRYPPYSRRTPWER